MTKLRILTGDAIPSEGVIGCDFFNNFTLVVDHIGGKMNVVYSFNMQ